MKVSDLAKEFNTSVDAVLARLKAMKLKAQDGNQELNAAVAVVLRSEFRLHAPPKVITAVKAEPITTRRKAAWETQEIKPKKVEKEKEKSAKSEKLDKALKKPARVSKSEEKKEAVKEKPVKIPEEKKPAIVPKAPLPPPPAKTKSAAFLSDEPFVSVKPLPRKKRKSTGPETKEPAQAVSSLEVKDVLNKGEGAEPRESQTEGVTGSEGKISVSQSVVSPQEQAALLAEQTKGLNDLEVNLPISIKDLSGRLQQKPSILLKQLLQMGVFANINQSLDEGVVRRLLSNFGFNLIKVKTQEEQLIERHKDEDIDPQLLKSRSPVVTFMGHVDHGKTSLLDRIRKSRVVEQEHGGITQHIGAYSVKLPKGRITFLDTPGHEAFTAMRARGAKVTDLVVLVVAADEGIMPQTDEAIDHARAANVPIVVALNKIDKKTADPERVKKQLAERNLMAEDWGGKTITQGVSAATGEGIDHLLEMILLEAELLELKANYDKKATGIVVEAHLSHGRGAIATLIVQNGTLREGDFIVVGPFYGRVKAMFDDYERPIKEAGPSMPVEVLGLVGVPEAGEVFYVIEDERRAKEISEQRQAQLKEKKMQSYSKITLEDIYTQIQEGIIKEMNVILKADVQGSLEALMGSLQKIPSEQIQLRMIHTGVGDINASDVILAAASNAIIIGFNVDVQPRAKEELEKNPVDIRTYRIIYDAINEVRKALEGLLEPKTRRKFVARVEIRQVFKLSKSGVVAGCFVQKGRVHRKVNLDVLRNGEVVFSGTLSSLKRFKDDVREVNEGVECGLTIHGFDQIQPGDIVDAYEIEKIARTL